MVLSDWVGGIAAVLTTVSFVPQVWQIWKTRHTQDISLRMYVLFTLGVSLWLAYGFLMASWPIIVSNFITLGLAGTVLYFKLRHG